MEACRSVIREAFRDRFIATELLSNIEVLFEEATKEWYAQRDPVEVDTSSPWKSIENDSLAAHLECYH